MTQETLISTEAANTTEGQAAAQAVTETTTTEVTDGSQQQQATETQTTEGQKTEGEGSKDDKSKAEGAPEAYDFKAPEGRTYDDAVIAQFTEVAKELNLTQDAAQKVLDKMAPAIADRQTQQLQAVRESWAESSKTDKEFGGEKLTENLTVAKKAMDAFATPELRTLLNESGLGNHPEVIRLLYRAGKAISEDKIVTGGNSSNTSADPAKRLFPNQA